MGIRFDSGALPLTVTDGVTTVDPCNEIEFTVAGSVTGVGTKATVTNGAGSLAIGDAVGGGTVGSVLFVGAGVLLAQDNSNFFFDDANNRLGIGTNAPAEKLEVAGGGGDNSVLIKSGADPTRTFELVAGGTQSVNCTNDLLINTGCSTEIRIGTLLANCEFTLADGQAGNQKIFNVDAQLCGGLWGKGVGYADTIANAQANSFFIEGFFAVGTPTPTANTKVQIVGDNALTTDFTFSLRNPLSSLMSVRNDGEIGIGRDAGVNGLSNIMVGDRAGSLLVGGIQNTGFGNSAIRELTGGTDNTGIGYNSLIACNIGRGNTGLGSLAGNNVTSGRFNTAIGYNCDTVTQTGQGNIIIGANVNSSGALASFELNIGDCVKGNLTVGTKEVELACQGASPTMTQSNDSVIFYEDAGQFKCDYKNGAGVVATFVLA